MFRYNSYQGSAWFSTANAVMGKVYEWDSEVQAYFSLVEVNRELTQRNIYLEKQVETLGNQLTTATRDSNWVSVDSWPCLTATSSFLPRW